MSAGCSCGWTGRAMEQHACDWRKPLDEPPCFDIVELPFPRNDAWAQFLGLFGIHLVVKIPQIVWRPGGQERAQRVFAQIGK